MGNDNTNTLKKADSEEKDTRVYDNRDNKTWFVGTTKECLDYLETKKDDPIYAHLWMADVITEEIFDDYKRCEELAIELAKEVKEKKEVHFYDWLRSKNVSEEILNDNFMIMSILENLQKHLNESENK